MSKGSQLRGKDRKCAKCGHMLQKDDTYTILWGNFICGPCSMRKSSHGTNQT